MFTGIIGALGTVESVQPVYNAQGASTGAAYITINAGDIVSDLDHGGSLAVNGVCLTAVDEDSIEPQQFRAYAMGETLTRTNLGTLTQGSVVNLERCMPASGRFDGHVVQGHVDGIATVTSITEHDAWCTVRFSIPQELAPYLVEKGSIAVSGVSLTVTAVSASVESAPWFEVGLIPETLSATNLGQLTVGDTVNLETDALAKYVARLMETRNIDFHETSVVAQELDSIQEAIEAISAGRAVVVVDDENRENEGDIIFAAEYATEELMGFTIRYTSGVICAPMSHERADSMNLPPMTAHNEDPKGTAYTVSCDARVGSTTGISAADRARTVRVLADASAGPEDLSRPGHIFPLRAVAGGVLERAGHTEAAVELTRAAGLSGVGVIAELIHDDGSMMRFEALRSFAAAHSLPMISIEDLIQYVKERACEKRDLAERFAHQYTASPLDLVPHPSPQLVESTVEVIVPTPHGNFGVRAWRFADGAEHMSIRALDDQGNPIAFSGEAQIPAVRIHSECATGDILGSFRCDCGQQLENGLKILSRYGGWMLYIRNHEGRGIGLVNKLRAYALQDVGLDTLDANLALGLDEDMRDYTQAALILQELGVHNLRLITNNPAKVDALTELGLEVHEVIPDEIPARAENAKYLETKRRRMGHRLHGPSI